MSGLFLDNHRNVNLYIAKWLSTNVAEFDKGTYFVNDMNLFLSKASAIKACNVNLSHFQDVTGLCVDFRGNGVIGISKFIYGITTNSVINNIVGH